MRWKSRGIAQDCHGQGNKSEKVIVPGQRKLGKKKLTKVREFRKILKTNGYGSLFNFQEHKFTEAVENVWKMVKSQEKVREY